LHAKLLLHKLRGHRRPLVSLHAVPPSAPPFFRRGTTLTEQRRALSQQVVSLDAGGSARVWVVSLEACAAGKVMCLQELSPWRSLVPRTSTLLCGRRGCTIPSSYRTSSYSCLMRATRATRSRL
jgi:hypothetical protein